jgi:hypothetical protein
MIMDAKNPVESRVVIAASIAFVCACGARSELETMDPAATPSSCPDDGDAGGEAEVPGCVFRASHISGADLSATTLIIPESPPGPNNLIGGAWIPGLLFGIGGEDGNGHWFRLGGRDVDALACGKSLPLGPTMNEPLQNHVSLTWGEGPTSYWTSTSGTLDVIAYEPGVSLEQRPIHVEVYGAPMAPGPDVLGSAPNNATGTFTADLSCRLEKFWHIPHN